MKTYNAALQAQLDAYLSEQSGLPQSKAAAMIGVSPTALSQYRNSKYPGDVEAVESKIEEFLRTRSAAAQAEAEKAPYLSAGYVPTSVSEDVYKAIQYCQLERGIVVLHGDAGIGKTRGAARFVQDNPANAIYIRCTPVGGTLTAMLRQLGTALKLPATRNRLELSMAIHDRLKGTDKVIIIDEAQNLRFDALEELRSLSDPDDLTGESGTGICLIGNSEVYSRMLGKQEAQFAQQFSRVRFRRRYSTADVKLADVEKLFPTLADGSHGKELAFMTGVCRSKWGMEVFNDADGSLINIYRCIKYHPEAVAAELALLPDSREVFFDSAAQTDCRGLTDIQRAARSLYLIKMSFGCDRRTFATAPKIAGNISASFAPVQERLRKVIIEHLDFEQLIRTYDRPNALFYCDPPYMGTEKYYQAAFSTADHERLARVLHNIRGRFLLSYNDCEAVRKLYEDCEITPLVRRNNLPSVSTGEFHEVLISNYTKSQGNA